MATFNGTDLKYLGGCRESYNLPKSLRYMFNLFRTNPGASLPLFITTDSLLKYRQIDSSPAI